MNIDRINTTKIPDLYKKNYNENMQIKSNKSVAKDNVTLSDSGKIFGLALKAVKDGLDIREEKVSNISNQIKNGNYKVNNNDIASKIIANSYFSK